MLQQSQNFGRSDFGDWPIGDRFNRICPANGCGEAPLLAGFSFDIRSCKVAIRSAMFRRAGGGSMPVAVLKTAGRFAGR